MARQAKRAIVSKTEVLAAIPGSKGLILNIEQKLYCTRAAVEKVIAENKDVAQELRDEQEREKDEVINALIEDAKAGDKAARELFLKSQAKDRGYGEKQETNNTTNQTLVFLHAPAIDLTPSKQNGFASKMDRIKAWEARAVEYHDKQTAEVNGKTVEELLGDQKK